MSEKVRIGEKFVPILPKEYRYEQGYIDCDDTLCAKYDIDCDICPFVHHKVKEKDLDIIESNQNLIEINLWRSHWGVTDLTLEDIKKYGIQCCDVECSNIDGEMECCVCKFDGRKILTLEEIKYRELE